MKRLLTFNAGSSTLKLGVFEVRDGHLVRLARGTLDLRLAPLQLAFHQDGQREQVPFEVELSDDLQHVIEAVLAWLETRFAGHAFDAFAHRLVHGGPNFAAPMPLDEDVLSQLEALVSLAPLHLPAGLRLVRAARRARPRLPQIGCFDTAFHQSQSALVKRLPIPRALHEEGVRRYGFHGLSYQSIADTLRREAPELLAKKLVVAHLGSGASLCAMENGISRDTSMSFSALDGIPMATRPGELDAGVILYLQQQRGWRVDEVQHWLYHECGLKGVSGISADSRVLLASDAPEAAEAIELFCFRIARGIAALGNSLGGLDGVVFTAGIGEHQPPVRARICHYLGWLGARLDAEANAANAHVLEAPHSRLALRMYPTDEEQVMAATAADCLQAGAGA